MAILQRGHLQAETTAKSGGTGPAVGAVDATKTAARAVASEIESDRERSGSDCAADAGRWGALRTQVEQSSRLRPSRPGEEFENLVLFIDDDLRETAMAIERVERYLLTTHAMLDKPQVNPLEIQRLARDAEVLEHLEALNETVESLRRRMARLADNLA